MNTTSSPFYQRITLIAIALAIFFVPNLFWGNQYLVGGDDTRMYYVMAGQLIQNFTSSIITQNRLGNYGLYSSLSYLTPLFYVLSLLSQLTRLLPIVNVQFVMYGLNMAAGFLGFYYCIRLYWNTSSKYLFFFATTAALAYVYSNFLIITLYWHQLLSIYAVSVCPIALYLFIRSVRENRVELSLGAILLYSIFSATLISLPWYGAFGLSVLPLLVWEWRKKPTIFVKMSIVSLLGFLVLNVHWIFDFIYAQIISKGRYGAVSVQASVDVAKASSYYITAISKLNTILGQLFQQTRAGWGVPIRFDGLHAVFLLPILLAGIAMKSSRDELERKKYLLGVVCLLGTIILFTPNIDDWSLRFFLFLNANIPLFAMFKTTYDKFALALAFQYSFALAASLWILHKKWPRTAVFLAIGIIVLTVYSAKDFLLPNYHDEKFSYRITGTLNKDFIDLTAYLARMDTGAHFVWLPLNFPSYIYVEDGRAKNHFYSGPSLITPMTGKMDYTGEYSFVIPGLPTITDEIVSNLSAKRYDAVGKIFQRLGIRYILLNKEVLPPAARGYEAWLWGNDHLDLLQSPDFLRSIEGRQIATFGSRYALYEINPSYATDTVYVTNSLDAVTPDDTLTYKKISESQYDVTIRTLSQKKYLVLLEPYYRSWELYLQDKDGQFSIPYEIGKNELVFGHGNGWVLDPEKIRKRIPGDGKQTSIENLRLRIQFAPARYKRARIAISIFGYIAVCCAILYCIVRRKNNDHE